LRIEVGYIAFNLLKASYFMRRGKEARGELNRAWGIVGGSINKELEAQKK